MVCAEIVAVAPSVWPIIVPAGKVVAVVSVGNPWIEREIPDSAAVAK